MTKKIMLVLGIVFLLVGVLGFFGNPIVGENALFHTDTIHNIIHIVTGLILLIVSASPSAPSVLKIFGVIYLLVSVLGFLSETGKVLGFLSVNSADNWLHLVLGVVILIAGFKAGKKEVISEVHDMNMGSGNSMI